MNLPLFIAGRYLFARKTHNVINIISGISAVGMAVGTAALVIILSVYNGFDELIKNSLSDIAPDVLVRPQKGKVFLPEGPVWDKLCSDPRVGSMCGTLEDNVFVNYDSHQSVALARGVDEIFEQEAGVSRHVLSGEFTLHRGEIPLCSVGSSLAYSLCLNPNFVSKVEFYYPARDRAVSMSNPAASIESVSMMPACVFSISADIDASLILLPLECMRELLGYEREVSSVEIRFADGLPRGERKAFMRELAASLPGYDVLDRYRQNESLYKMMRYEKAAIFLILLFVVIIIAFNIFGSLSMLVIEKKEDIGTLSCLGARASTIRRVFIYEGWMVSLLGMACGLVTGILLCLLQQKFGIVRMPGSYVISSYPVKLELADVLVTSLGVALVGYVISVIPVLGLRGTDNN